MYSAQFMFFGRHAYRVLNTLRQAMFLGLALILAISAAWATLAIQPSKGLVISVHGSGDNMAYSALLLAVAASEMTCKLDAVPVTGEEAPPATTGLLHCSFKDVPDHLDAITRINPKAVLISVYSSDASLPIGKVNPRMDHMLSVFTKLLADKPEIDSVHTCIGPDLTACETNESP